jgi:small subunit ribosomal protein S31
MSGLEEEQNVPFYDHVLLDHLLEGFPDKGPVRQFMELVLIGLSNNPYITVERKDATVQYYREYFKEKEDVLRASGALG